MLTLLVVKENLREFYSKYSIVLNIIIKFVLALICLLIINYNMAYLEATKSIYLILVISIFCSILPYGAIVTVLSVYILANIYKVSLEMTLIVAVFLLIIAILYYSFSPKDAYILILTPVLFAFKIPYLLPFILGLGGSLISIIPVSCGIFMYFLFIYIKQNLSSLVNNASVEVTQKYTQMLNAIIGNKLMILLIIAFAVTIVSIYLLKKLSFDYARTVALVVGVVLLLIVIFVGNILLAVSLPVPELIAGIIISTFVAYVYDFFILTVDYTRTEFTQFEDDDYYYYVKAVPKLSLKASDKKVQNFTNNNQERKVHRKTID